MTVRDGRRDLVLLATGQAVSIAGDSAALVALLLRLRTAGSSWVAALLAAELVPFFVCAPFTGRIVDRIETRRLLLCALIGQAGVAVPLAFVSTPVATVALFAALSTLSTLVRPATSALVPAIVGSSAASDGFARLSTGVALGWIVGPAAGGLITGAVGVPTTLLVDAASFGATALAIAVLRVRRHPQTSTEHVVGPRSVGGFRTLWGSPPLRTGLAVSAVATGCAVVDNVAAPFRIVDQLGTDAVGYGLYLTTWSIGALVGVQLVPRVGQHHHVSALAAGNFLMGVGIAGIGLAPTFVAALIAAAAGGLGNGAVDVAENTLIAHYVAGDRHGRAFAAAGTTKQCAIGAGTLAAAPLVSALGAGHAMATAGVFAASVALAGLVGLVGAGVGRNRLGPHVQPPPSDRPSCA